MIQLPYSEELNIGYLSRLFDDTSNCYKFCWFQAILSKLSSEHTRFTFDNIAKYHLNNSAIARELYCDGLTEEDFKNRLYNVIHPVYDAARNNGFREWVYEGELCQ